MRPLLAAIIVLSVSAGCYLPHHAIVAGTMISHRSLIDRPFEELGLVHAESWGLTIYWKMSGASLQHAAGVALVAEATRRGADAVIDVETRVENHYSLLLPVPLPVMFGWEECHATGTAIRFTDKEDPKKTGGK
jgi:uncharacterized protein YbjQ (UPF0145 family)